MITYTSVFFYCYFYPLPFISLLSLWPFLPFNAVIENCFTCRAITIHLAPCCEIVISKLIRLTIQSSLDALYLWSKLIKLLFSCAMSLENVHDHVSLFSIFVTLSNACFFTIFLTYCSAINLNIFFLGRLLADHKNFNCLFLIFSVS